MTLNKPWARYKSRLSVFLWLFVFRKEVKGILHNLWGTVLSPLCSEGHLFLMALWGYVSSMWQVTVWAECVWFAGGGRWDVYGALAPERDGKSRAHREMQSGSGSSYSWRTYVEKLRQKIIHMIWARMLWVWDSRSSLGRWMTGVISFLTVGENGGKTCSS